MTRNSTFARVAAVAAGLSMAFATVLPAGAVTVAELQAQIAVLMQQLSGLQGGATVSVTFTRDLTVGSTGSDVSALQQMLVTKGYLTMPNGVAYGYFGLATKSAVARWQAAAGVSATGYFGPISRAKANAGTTTGGTTTGGTTTGGTTTGGVAGGITTPGKEGSLTVTSSPVSASTFYEGEDMVSVLAFKAKATGSDLSVQSVKVDLGTDADLYRSVLSRIYVVDDSGKTIASADLNSNTVVKNASDQYEISLTGINSIVSMGTTRSYSVKVDVKDSIDSADLTSYTVRLAANGVRAVDGAGINLYSPSAATDVSRSVTFSASLAESATLTVSTNSATPLAQELVAAGGSSENEADKVVLMVFDIRAEKDAVEITDLKNFAITRSAGAGTASTSYLYVGNGVGGQLLGTSAVTVTDADFTDISYMIPANTTKTFTLAVDIRSAGATQTTFDASFTGNTTNVIGERQSDGKTVSTVSGSADANNLLVRNIGPVFSLVSTPTISRNSGTIGIANGTSTASASYSLKVKAVGADIIFGNNASTTYPMISNGTGAPARSLDIYLGGAVTNPAVASSTDYSTPSGYTETSNSFTLQENQEVTIPVTYTFEGRTTAGVLVTTGSYAVGLERINWVSGGTQYSSTFMDGRTEWRSPTVAMP